MKKSFHFFFVVVLLGFCSCEKMLFEEDGLSGDPFVNFDYLWNECNEKYTFFEYKGIDWELTRATYRQKIFTGMTSDSLFRVLAGMLNELEDGHVNLVSSFNVSRFFIERLGRDNYDERIVNENYLNYDFYSTGPFRHSALENNRIAYVRFASFTGTVTHNQLDFILNRYRNTQGLIFDIRENGGGSSGDIYRILAHFATERTLLFYSEGKAGPDYNDFLPPQAVYAEPREIGYSKPIVVLTDRSTYSSGSFLTLGAKQMAHVTVMGDTTGGGLGVPNGGQLPNGWTYRFSVTRTLDVDGNNFENGVPPDIYVITNDEDRAAGVDTILEAAIEELL